MIGQNYERAGWEPVGLHTLMARPALESTAVTAFDSRSVVDAVNRVVAGFTRAPKVRRLPQRVLPGELASLADKQGRARRRWCGHSMRPNVRCSSTVSIC